jgi:hypothetical protein
MIRKTNGLCALIALGVFAMSAPALAAGPRNGTTLAASKTLEICEINSETWLYYGVISVWNEGRLETKGLDVSDCIQSKADGEQFENVYCIGGINAGAEIEAGTTLATATPFEYEIAGAPLPLDSIRNAATVTILNHSGSLEVPKGPQPKDTWTGGTPPLCDDGNTVFGCTLTQGYWKNHEEDWPAPYVPNDPVDHLFYLSGVTWDAIFDIPPGNPNPNKYYVLAHQYIAAVLNVASGASVPDGVQGVLSAAEDFFGDVAPAACVGGASCGIQNTWAEILTLYNEGEYVGGPPHCPS